MENNFDLKAFLVENKLTTSSRLLEEQGDSLLTALQTYIANCYTVDQGWGEAQEAAEQEQEQLRERITQAKGEEYFKRVEEFGEAALYQDEYVTSHEQEVQIDQELEELSQELGYTVQELRNI